ncbi:aminotransferase class I/II-fold pyridoxal phosphate-dependent enzyme [Aneurinibacillus aneurinilyticus]|jgi:arginine/lysine/ornithine decarboxylase|uniref:aminotransferase class I/II-fold pyridoxal phosphate-dependent enzyme n=1 Tax=Aneurinibacillus aneurinilyticus TaxID=1391 RepID=UPI0023F67BDE|nr:aminotransferase class I/II-fold pyridoxal phosphate-dependent enzyme [Aneurinibacillus aneurinilyticus]MCI1695358.1 aminotransferase class I/II-fold pyridoxal phosphate-dependent enzyme [Aneurinibacillus aneurinilyticus]
MNHKEAPLYEALCMYEENCHQSLHVPGHKDGNTFDGEAMLHFHSILKVDATEINGLDDLHHPTGVIARAQELAADAFGAEHTFFLIGGSTAGNLAAALTLCNPGDVILVQRNAHKSVFNGLMLAGAQPVYVLPDIEPDTQVAAGINPEHLQIALCKYPQAKAAWITNPNYYGMGQNVAELANICHQAGIPLIVDEAHGAHFGQADVVPSSSLQAGADLVIQSTHKMLTAMTMASMLHVQGTLIPREKLAGVLAMVQSSSPSYPLMASLDVSRRHLVIQGRTQLSYTVEKLERYRIDVAKELQHLSIWEQANDKTACVHNRDPLKWVLKSKHSSITGYQLLEYLQDKGCVAEMADVRNVVLVFSIDARDEDIERMVSIIRKIDEEIGEHRLAGDRAQADDTWDITGMLSGVQSFIEPAIPLREAFYKKSEEVTLQEAIGRCSAEMIIPYPPGIPLLTPGEIITSAHIEAIRRIKRAGGYFQGASDEKLEKMFVLVNL